MSYAEFGVRSNVVMLGQIDSASAMHTIAARRGMTVDARRTERDANVPLRKKQGSGWDTAYAALFLASDEATFITGAVLPVDGGQSGRIG